jgi:hypothetical protein
MTSVHGSNVHEAFALMATLLGPRVPVRYLEMSGQLLQRRQMEEVFEERAAARRCAFPACGTPLSKCVNCISANPMAQYPFSTNLITAFWQLWCMEQDDRQTPGIFGPQGDLRRSLRAPILLAALSQGTEMPLQKLQAPNPSPRLENGA